MEFELTTPALLFPAISLLMLAYTNRFVVIAALFRELLTRKEEECNAHVAAQLANLARRIQIIKQMQILGALSFFFCVTCMFLVFSGSRSIARVVFGGSLLLLLGSLALLLWELHISVDALLHELAEYQERKTS